MQLPTDIDPDSGRAALRNGVLKLEFKKRNGTVQRRHRIEVT